jgi:chromate transporter
LLYGIKPIVIAIVLQALWRLGRSAVKGPALALLGLGAAAAVLLGTDELLVLLVGGLLAAAWARIDAPAIRLSPALVPAVLASGVAVPFGLGPLFLIFLKIGSVLFGSGYVLLAFLRADLVERLGWLSERQLLDAVAVGQMTPGPVFTTATFVGYLLGGSAGAVVATLGIFLPAFVFVALSGRLLPRLQASPTARAALDGVNVVSLALMAVVTWQLSRSALVDPITIGLALVSAVVLLRFRVNSAWLVAFGAAFGVLAYRG